MTASGNHASPAIEFINVGMDFGSLVALDDVSLSLERHRFHVLLGENGAGKSTLVKCLVGYQAPSRGHIAVAGGEVKFGSPREAHAAGIGMVYQNFTLADQLTVGEHFLLSKAKRPWVVDRRRELAELRSFMDGMPFRLDLDRACGDLASGEKQKLEILLQLFQKPRVLVLDEPSSVLTPGEADEVFRLLKAKVEARELTVLLITHKFREMLEYGDDVAVLRHGRLVGNGPVASFAVQDLAELMVGEAGAPAGVERARVRAPGDVRLAIDMLNLRDSRGAAALRNLSLRVRAGEIYGIAGVSGNGQKELVEALSGVHPAACRHIAVDGRGFEPTVAFFKKAGFNLLPELPLRNACVGAMSLWENLSFRSLDQGRSKQRDDAAVLRDIFGVKAHSLGQPIGSLSGGNVQRAVLARELRADTRILVVANPCFGLDFQATAFIRSQLAKARDRGCAVLLLSEDIDEVLALSDRVGVMFEGSIVAEWPIDQADPSKIGIAMAGHGPVRIEAEVQDAR